MSRRLERRARLRARRQFAQVQEHGRRVGMSCMTVLAKASGLDCDRLGIIASRKLGGAVARNRAKRRLRAAFRDLEPDMVAARRHLAMDIVVIPRREALRVPFSQLHRDLESALARLDRTRRA